jgi:hypothetical protein
MANPLMHPVSLLAIGAMLFFMIVLLYVSIEDQMTGE